MFANKLAAIALSQTFLATWGKPNSYARSARVGPTIGPPGGRRTFVDVDDNGQDELIFYCPACGDRELSAEV